VNHQRSRLDEDRTEQCWSPQVEPSIADAYENLFRPLQRLRSPWHPDRRHAPSEGWWRLQAVRRQQINDEVVALITIPVPLKVRVVECEAVAAERRIDRRQRAAGPRLTKHIDVPRRAHVDHAVVPHEGLEPAVSELVQAIARSSAYTVATGKQAFYSQIDRAEDDAYGHCELVMTENALAHDAQEGMTAFLEKRSPVWRGE
jgi:hypothetical protein